MEMVEYINIKGYEGVYMMNKSGHVLSFHNKVRVLKNSLDFTGYLRVNLIQNGVKKVMRIHRILALHYLPSPDNKPHVNHKDGNKLNNDLPNLEWCTVSENNQHAYDLGLKKTGENHSNSKLSNEDVKEIRILRKQNFSQSTIASIYNVSREHIRDIVNLKKRLHG